MIAVAVIVILFVNKATGFLSKSNRGNTLNPTKKVTDTPTPTMAAKTETMPYLVGQNYNQAKTLLPTIATGAKPQAPTQRKQFNEKRPSSEV